MPRTDKFFLLTFSDPAKRGPQTAAVMAQTKQWAVEKFLRANPDLAILSAIAARRGA